MLSRGVIGLGFIGMALSQGWAIDDLLLYSDIGCDKTGIDQSYAQVNGGTMTVATGQKIPVTCTDKHRGTDAIDLNLSGDLAIGGYYDFVVKFPDWSQKSVSDHKDVRFFVKNLLSTPAHLAVRWENGTYQPSTRRALDVPVSAEWVEVVIPMSDYGDFTKTGKMNGFVFSQPNDVVGSRMHLLVDDLRITDGSGQGTLELPKLPGGVAPVGWLPNLITGVYDNHGDQLTQSKLNGKVDYRYQYLTEGWKGYAQGRLIETFVENGKAVGARSAFTWYLVAKAGESGPTVKSNLNSATFMKTYFDDYELALDQLAKSKAESPLLIIEPDMYGFLLQGAQVPNQDATQCTVDMSYASTLSGTVWANTLKGYCEYMVQHAKAKVPGVIVGHLINSWSTLIPGEIGQGSLDSHLSAAATLAVFINSLGERGKGDVVFVEKSDRDAGTKGVKWSWGDVEYQRYFAWVKTLSARSNLRICGWQVSEGMTASPAINKDDAVERFRDHASEWADAGFIGVLFGPGTEGQADYGTNGEAFLAAMAAYRAKPQPIVVGSGISMLRVKRGNGRLRLVDGQSLLLQGNRGNLNTIQVLRLQPSLLLGRQSTLSH